MNPKQIYKQTYDFEKRILQLDNPIDGFSDLDIDKLSNDLEDISKKIKKKYTSK